MFDVLGLPTLSSNLYLLIATAVAFIIGMQFSIFFVANTNIYYACEHVIDIEKHF